MDARLATGEIDRSREADRRSGWEASWL